MKTTITLQRRPSVVGWRVTGTMALAAKREWEPAVLRLAVDRGGITPELVVHELLGGRAPVARRLLHICVHLGLLERKDRELVPTTAGRNAAETGLVLLPERGTWTVWIGEDPLLPAPIVAVAPWREPSAMDERGKDVRRSIAKLPTLLTGAIGRVVEPLAGEHGAIRVDDLGGEQKGERVPELPQILLTLSLSPKGARVRITGNLEGQRLDADVPPPPVTHRDALTALLRQAGLSDRWDAHRDILWCRFGEADDGERASLERAVRCEHPELPGAGRFDATTLEHVPLRPWSEADAAAWAEWRLVHDLDDHAVGDKLAARYRTAAAPFADLAPPCPPRAAIAGRLRGSDRPPPTYWRLQGPADWALDEGGQR